MEEIRNPKQERAILKKNKIIEEGFKLITKNGYHNTNTKQIADYAGISTGIIYQYFKDKHDILIAGINKYGDEVFFPVLKIKDIPLKKEDVALLFKNIINTYIKDHKLSQSAHEEITAMIHSDKDVAKYFYEREMDATNKLYDILKNYYNSENLKEKVHIIIGMIDNLCHEIVFHKHEELNYEVITNLVIDNIIDLLKK